MVRGSLQDPAEDSLILAIGGRANPGPGRCRGVDPHGVQPAMAGQLVRSGLDRTGVRFGALAFGVVVAEDGDSPPIGVNLAYLKPDRGRMPADASVDTEMHRVALIVFSRPRNVLGHVERREPGAGADIEDLPEDLL